MTQRTYDRLRLTFPDQSSWTLPWVLRHRAETHGSKIYLEVPHQDVALTFRATLEAAEAIAQNLLKDGGRPGDRVLLMASNCAEVILGWFGACLAGMVEVPINTAYEGAFLAHQVRTTEPTTAIVHAEFVARFLADAVSIERFYILGSSSAVETAIAELHARGVVAYPFDRLRLNEAPPELLPTVEARDLASVFFTSGTTGLSKGVMMTHSQMTFFADECVSLTHLTDRDTYMAVGPLFHGNSQFLAALPSLLVGARFVLREKYSASRWAAEIRDCSATVTNFVGIMMDWTWQQPARPDDADNCLRCVFAAPTASSILERFKTRFGIEAFVEVFGLTETSAPIMAPYGEERPPGAAGLLVDKYFDVRLVDPDTDLEVPTGEVGELVVRAKLPGLICSGYFNMPEKTIEAQRNLWFHTGDGLRRDNEGWYYFVDRLKDAIRRRGENISSYEIEQVVLGHPSVEQCAVVGMPAAAEAGEDEVVVFVVPVAGSDVNEADLLAWCCEHVPSFARPQFVAILLELPMTPSGKVRKLELRERAIALASGSASGTSTRRA